MKTYSLGLLGLLLTVCCGVAHSQTAWLLVSRSTHHAVVRAQGETVRDVVLIPDAAPNYAESHRVVTVVSDGWVHVVEKGSGMVTSFQLATHPEFMGTPTANLSGPLRNMLVTDSHAFFPTVRVFGEAPLNQLDGQYDIVQMSLTDGSLRSIPLPEDCVDPRLAEIGNVPVVYSPNNDKAWMLDAANARFVRILSNDDVVELRTKEVVGLRSAPDTPRALIRYAIVPGAGVFRLSRLGELEKVLDANLARISAPTDSVTLGRAHDVLTLLPGTSNGSAVIGVVRRQDGRVTFSRLDAYSLDVAWVTDVAPGAIPDSFYAARDDSTFYIDGPSGAVNRLSQRNGSATIWHVQPSQSTSARILSIDVGG